MERDPIIAKLKNEIHQLRGALAWAMMAINEYADDAEETDEDWTAGYLNATELLEGEVDRGFTK
jgi:hypothetical protein